jgi:hypothetical protein
MQTAHWRSLCAVVCLTAIGCGKGEPSQEGAAGAKPLTPEEEVLQERNALANLKTRHQEERAAHEKEFQSVMNELQKVRSEYAPLWQETYAAKMAGGGGGGTPRKSPAEIEALEKRAKPFEDRIKELEAKANAIRANTGAMDARQSQEREAQRKKVEAAQQKVSGGGASGEPARTIGARERSVGGSS